jgi:hypothetical protein
MADEDRPFNKAAQLKPILEAARIVPSAVVARVHLARVFGVSEDDDELIQSRLKHTRKAIREVQRDLKKVPDINHELYLSWVRPSIQMLTVANLDKQFSADRTIIDTNDIVKVAFCEDTLRRYTTEDHIADETLAGIRTSVEQLKADILGSGFDHDLEEALVDALQALLIAIDEYALRGVARLKEGLAVAVGTVVINFGMLKKPGVWNRWQKHAATFAAIAGGLWTAIQFALKNRTELQQGLVVIQGLLGMGPGEPPPEE